MVMGKNKNPSAISIARRIIPMIVPGQAIIPPTMTNDNRDMITPITIAIITVNKSEIRNNIHRGMLNIVK